MAMWRGKLLLWFGFLGSGIVGGVTVIALKRTSLTAGTELLLGIGAAFASFIVYAVVLTVMGK